MALVFLISRKPSFHPITMADHSANVKKEAVICMLISCSTALILVVYIANQFFEFKLLLKLTSLKNSILSRNDPTPTRSFNSRNGLKMLSLAPKSMLPRPLLWVQPVFHLDESLSRVVLFKELDKDGSLVIYSNWGTSKKSKDVNSNARSQLFWPDLFERQVRVEGTTEFLSNGGIPNLLQHSWSWI